LFDVLGETKIRDFPDNKVRENYLGFEYNFNYALKKAGFGNAHNENNPDKSPKGLSLFLKVKEQLKSSNVKIPDWITQIKEKIVEALPEEAESILKSTTQEEIEEVSKHEDLPF